MRDITVQYVNYYFVWFFLVGFFLSQNSGIAVGNGLASDIVIIEMKEKFFIVQCVVKVAKDAWKKVWQKTYFCLAVEILMFNFRSGKVTPVPLHRVNLLVDTGRGAGALGGVGGVRRQVVRRRWTELNWLWRRLARGGRGPIARLVWRQIQLDPGGDGLVQVGQTVLVGRRWRRCARMLTRSKH